MTRGRTVRATVLGNVDGFSVRDTYYAESTGDSGPLQKRRSVGFEFTFEMGEKIDTFSLKFIEAGNETYEFLDTIL